MLSLHPGRPGIRDSATSVPASGLRTSAGPWGWLLGGALLFFLVPFVGIDVLDLQRDLYYVAYFTVALVWAVAFLATYGDALRDLWRSRLPWSLAVGALAGVAVVTVVLAQAGTDHPDGWRWWFEIGWRGVVYGSVDTVVLFVFPAAIAFLAMHGNRSGAARRFGYAGLVLALSLLMSTAYHLGYPEYRDSDLRSPLIGTVLASSAAAVTGNPLGAYLTHVPAHVAAVVHQDEGGPTHMLPPTTADERSGRGDTDVAVALAGLWLLGTVGVGTLVVRRQRAG